MKRILAIVLALMLVAAASAQERQLEVLKSSDWQGHKPTAEYQTDGLSSTTAFLVADLMQLGREVKDSDTELIKKYALIKRDGTYYVNAFVTPRGSKETHTQLIAVNGLVEFASSGECDFIDIGVMCRPMLDAVRPSTHVTEVHNGAQLPQHYYGTGVVVGIIDMGFEYGHKTFYDTLGSTYRVKRLWNQNASSGSAPSGYNYGSEYTTASAIQDAQYDYNDQSHGTHVAGIAAGSGGASTGSRAYRGMAPMSDIVLVSSNGSSAGIYDAITYIASYARSQSKPCVINMSWGNHLGPHDGTSSFDRQCDTYTQQHPQGLLLVGSAGNEGADNLFMSKTFSATDTLLQSFIDFDGYSSGAGYIDIWGTPGQTFYATVAIVNTSTGQFEDSYGVYCSSTSTASATLHNSNNQSASLTFYRTPSNQYNNKPNITIAINSYNTMDQTHKLFLRVGAASGSVMVWGNSNTFTSENFSGITTGNSTHTVGELGGTGNSMISVGAYVTKNSWTTALGYTYSYTSCNPVGQIADFSSKGPTADNRVKPDITAPGQAVASSVNRFDQANYNNNGQMTVFNYTFGGVTYRYGIMQGTSMSAPAVTGILALWLQANPNLTIAQAKQYLRQTAVTDNYTGSIGSTGSNTWGWGKVNAWSGIRAVTGGGTGGNIPVVSIGGPTAAEAGTPVSFTASLASGSTDGLTYSWTFQNGTPSTATGSSVSTTWNQAGVYTVTLTATNSYGSGSASLQVEVTGCGPIVDYPYHEDFANGLGCWSTVDADGDGHAWESITFSGNPGMGSASFINEIGALTPDNWLISPRINLPAQGPVSFYWKVRGVDANYYAEHYSVYLSTTGNQPSDFTTQLYTGTVPSVGFTDMGANLSNYAGQQVYVAFRHHDITNVYWMLVDDISITKTNYVGVEEASASTALIYARGGEIVVQGAEGESLRIVDMMGRILHTERSLPDNGRFAVSHSGIYLVQVGNQPAKKVVVVR